jgi:hypothetical protein
MCIAAGLLLPPLVLSNRQAMQHEQPRHATRAHAMRAHLDERVVSTRDNPLPLLVE